MDIKIKNFPINMDVKQSGIEFQVNKPNNGDHLGDCYLTNTGLIWCSGRKSKDNGTKISWDEFIKIMESKDIALNSVKKK